ncbi:MAG: hypothetical protein A2083_11265 [Gemmatimonadetes bacterium GWC2_71_9]|nr:MAG: hypothetical protein A2083_11265 [Gemmatimonadetes bacterium GWC2_71_9]
MHSDVGRSPLAVPAFAGLLHAFSRAIAEECLKGTVNVIPAAVAERFEGLYLRARGARSSTARL